jgi:hypothetical protein
MNFDKLNGLVPAVVQDDESGEVLMVGFMNEEALDLTRATGYVTFFSRTRGTLCSWTATRTRCSCGSSARGPAWCVTPASAAVSFASSPRLSAMASSLAACEGR